MDRVPSAKCSAARGPIIDSWRVSVCVASDARELNVEAVEWATAELHRRFGSRGSRRGRVCGHLGAIWTDIVAEPKSSLMRGSLRSRLAVSHNEEHVEGEAPHKILVMTRGGPSTKHIVLITAN